MIFAQAVPTISPEVGVHQPALYLFAVAALGGFMLLGLYMWRKDRIEKEKHDTMLCFVKEQSERMDVAMEKRDATIMKMGESCHQTQQDLSEQSANVIDRNTTAIKENTAAMATNNELVRDVRTMMREFRKPDDN